MSFSRGKRGLVGSLMFSSFNAEVYDILILPVYRDDRTAYVLLRELGEYLRDPLTLEELFYYRIKYGDKCSILQKGQFKYTLHAISNNLKEQELIDEIDDKFFYTEEQLKGVDIT